MLDEAIVRRTRRAASTGASWVSAAIRRPDAYRRSRNAGVFDQLARSNSGSSIGGSRFTRRGTTVPQPDAVFASHYRDHSRPWTPTLSAVVRAR